MHAEMRLEDMVPGEDWPLYIDGERVGEIYDWETGQEICRILNNYDRLMDTQKALWRQLLEMLSLLAMGKEAD